MRAPWLTPFALFVFGWSTCAAASFLLPNEDSEGVSIVNLIAAPSDFDGKRVRVVGFLALEFEGTALYLHEEDCRRRITRNGVWLALPRQVPEAHLELRGRYVLVEGTFSAGRKGHGGMASGSIGEITRLVAWRVQLPGGSTADVPHRDDETGGRTLSIPHGDGCATWSAEAKAQ